MTMTFAKDYWDEDELEELTEEEEKAWLDEDYDPGRKKKWV
jgi:hypothetical protein